MTATDQKNEFKQRVRHWAEKLDVKVVWLGVRSMSNKWASCSTAGHLNFSDELLRLDAEFWDYVIVHELLHFFVPNHGKLWKSLMRVNLGDYECIESELRKASSVVSPSRDTSAVRVGKLGRADIVRKCDLKRSNMKLELSTTDSTK